MGRTQFCWLSVGSHCVQSSVTAYSPLHCAALTKGRERTCVTKSVSYPSALSPLQDLRGNTLNSLPHRKSAVSHNLNGDFMNLIPHCLSYIYFFSRCSTLMTRHYRVIHKTISHHTVHPVRYTCTYTYRQPK